MHASAARFPGRNGRADARPSRGVGARSAGWNGAGGAAPSRALPKDYFIDEIAVAEGLDDSFA